MSNTQPKRKADIQSKIAYAKHRHQELMAALFEAKKAATDPAYLVHNCADIISTARECFDYLGQDIIECHILPITNNARALQDHAAGKLKAYFPYYSTQITRTDSIFHELSATNPSLYQALLDFATNLANNSPIPNTLFTHKLLLDVKDMVNEKKHDKLIGLVSQAEQEYLLQNEKMNLLIPMKDQKGWASFSVEPGTQVSQVTEYRFAYNDQEIGKFCLFATNATEHVITKFYQTYFAQSPPLSQSH